MKRNVFFVLILITIVLTALIQICSAGIYEFPEIKPEIRLWSGYRFIDAKDSPRAGEFEYLHDSLSAGGELWAFPFPHRIHLEGDVLNENDYFGDAGYAYKDLVLSRWITRRVYHNLDNLTLADFDPSTLSPGVETRDTDSTYGVRTDINKYFLRLKAPQYPFHLYFECHLFQRNGTQQKRFLGGSGYYNNLTRVSSQRDIDWKTEDYCVGTNNHLGPMEIDVSHSDRKFTPAGNKVLYEAYDPAGYPSGSLRPGGTYAFGLVPELEITTDTLKVHTSYTGRIVGSATVSRTVRENNSSGAQAEYWLGYGELVFMPMAKLTFLTKYRHQETDVDNPDSVTVVDQSNPAIRYSYTDIKPSISSTVDALTCTARYIPIKNLTLKAEYIRERKERENQDAQAWHLSHAINHDVYDFSAYSNILKKVKFKIQYIHRDTDQEAKISALDIEPESSDQGGVSLSWMPCSRATALLNYKLTRDTTDNLHILDEHGSVVADAHDRERLWQRCFGSVTFQVLKNLSLTPGYTFIQTTVNQDLVYSASPSSDPYIDNDVKSNSKAYACDFTIMYMASENLDLSTLINYTKSHDRFYPSTPEALDPVSLASFSEVSIEELTYEFEGAYRFRNGWGMGLRYRHTDYDDDSPDNPQSSAYSSTLLTISKKW